MSENNDDEMLRYFIKKLLSSRRFQFADCYIQGYNFGYIQNKSENATLLLLVKMAEKRILYI